MWEILALGRRQGGAEWPWSGPGCRFRTGGHEPFQRCKERVKKVEELVLTGDRGGVRSQPAAVLGNKRPRGLCDIRIGSQEITTPIRVHYSCIEHGIMISTSRSVDAGSISVGRIFLLLDSKVCSWREMIISRFRLVRICARRRKQLIENRNKYKGT